MSKFDLDEMNSCYLDVLREIGNIGAGNATTALAQLLQRKVDMTVPQAELLEFKEVGRAIGGEESIMAGVYMVVEGDISGSMMFLLEKESARHLVNQMLCKPDDEGSASDLFDEMEISVMKEIGNIITGAYLNSLSDLTHLKIYPSVPAIAIDMAGAILSVPAIEFGVLGDKILMIQTRFSDDIQIDGFFILVPDVDSYQKILESLGIA
ncbi:MAG: chemotaxis protein CheC [Lachnospiraceae bacterium]|nr:chemotaxis protein CheC [Lachnospiraceae bacterium]